MHLVRTSASITAALGVAALTLVGCAEPSTSESPTAAETTATGEKTVLTPVSYTHLTLPTNREV